MAKKTVKKKAAKKATKTVAKKSAPKKATKTVAKKPAAKKPAVKKPAEKKADYKPTALMADIEYLMQMMVAHDVTEVEVEEKSGRKIEIKRGTVAAAPVVAAAVAPVAAPVAAAAPAAAAPAAPAEAPAPKVDDNLIEIKSPMVGTFYSAPSPDSDAYVANGSNVNDESVVCIVEAMKVMNEIKAECSGTIIEICVKNADPIEFGQVLFKVKPN